LGRSLLHQGLVDESTDGYSLLTLNALSMEILKNQRKVEIAIAPAKPTVESNEDISTNTAEIQALFNRLQKLRKQYADANKVAPYVIFADSSLRLMAQQQPQTLAQFAQISGVGARKLAQYGEMFTGEIRAFRGESGLSVKTETDPVPPLPAPRKTEITNTHLQTLDLYHQGFSISEIASQRGMKDNTVGDHIIKLIESNYEVNIDRIVPLDRQTIIKTAIEKVGANLLSPIKAELGDEFSYEEIKLIRAKFFPIDRSS
jgi:ATP-dependent DNA helicase RecQ